MSDGRFYYVLADGRRAGLVSKGRFSAEQVTADAKERLLAFGVAGGIGHAMSLIEELGTVHFYDYKEGAFVRVLDRDVDLTAGIGDIGDFLAHTDGSFWFTILSAKQGLEAGVGVVYDDREEVTFHGSLPQPPDLGVAIPDGVNLLELAGDGSIWLGGLEGAVRLDTDLKPTVYREPQGLVGDMVSDLAVDGEEKLWVLTADGLGWFEDGDWRFPDRYPYRDNVISLIGVDEGGNLVLADEEAVRRRSGDDWEVVIALEDLPGVEVLDATEGADGRLWVVTDRAIAIEPGE
jgi:hypothetical protein